MSIQTERQNEIVRAIRVHGYMTVGELTSLLHYSTATINRDLNTLEEQRMVIRNYGGVRLAEPMLMPFSERAVFLRGVKRKIANAAASLVEDGDTIFIDGSTTTQYMGYGLRQRKNLTVITHNNALAATLCADGIRTISLGGEMIESPSVTGGTLAVENAAIFMADKFFFSTTGVTADGRILTSFNVYRPLITTMMRNSKKSFYLFDRDKMPIDPPCQRELTYLCDFGKLAGVISDVDFDDEFRARFPDTEFISPSD